MTENSPPRNKDASAGLQSNGNGGAFASRRNSEPDAGSAPRRQRHAGVSATGATVIESPVGDRDKNYWVAFHYFPSNVRIQPADAGIADQDGPELVGHHKLTIRAESDSELNVKYTNMPLYAEGLHAAIAGYGSSEMDLLEQRIKDAFRERYNGKVVPFFRLHPNIAGFEPGPRWHGLRLEYTDQIGEDDAVLNEERDGTVGFFTSNLMARLESDPAYVAVRDGSAFDYILELV